MEKTRRYALIALPVVVLIALAVALVGGPVASAGPGSQVCPQGTLDLGTAFTYQGSLMEGPDPANGLYDLTFSLYDSLEGDSQIGPSISRSIPINDGLFTVELDFGAVFDGSALWLEVGVRESGSAGPYATLRPRQRLTPAPFASYAVRTSWSGIAGVPEGFGDDVDDDTLGDLGCSAGQIARWNGSSWECAVDLVGEGAGWSLTGNAGTMAGSHFLGTTDDQPLELHVNGGRALRLEPNSTSPNVLGGYSGNDAGIDVSGATIGGGGRDLATNQVSASFGTVGGGANNLSGGYAASVGGGEDNSADDSYATAGGGYGNTAGGPASTVGGGSANDARGPFSAIGGGAANVVTAAHGTIAGGLQNAVDGSSAVVGGGASNTAVADYATAGGGRHNSVAATYGTIAGGGPSDPGNPTTTGNRVYDEYGTVGGGGGNVAGVDDADATGQSYATVAGGNSNAATAQYAVAGGGTGNAASGYAASVGGGQGNAAGDNYATVAGGLNNTAGGRSATVAGGQSNAADTNYAAVGGGLSNEAAAALSTIAGGSANVVAATYGTIPGGVQNFVGGDYGFAAGYGARVEHAGSFVWSGATEPFTTTAPHQFLVDAPGGVGIGTNSPSHMLTVDGSTAVLGSGELTARGVYTSSWRLLDAPSAIDAAGSLVYVTSYSTNTLAILDVSDPDSPLPLGWTTSNMSGPADVQIVGQRAYVASQLNDRLVVIDVSDPHNPDSLGSSDRYLGNPVAVYVSGRYAYVASSGAGDGSHDGLAILDIGDPANIVAKGFTSTNLSGTSDVYVSGKYAYVTSHDNDRLAVFDVSDPRAIEAQGFASDSLDGPTAVHVRGNYAYVLGGNSNNLVIFDISDPNDITLVGDRSISLAQPRSVFLSGDYAYVAFAGQPATAIDCGLAVFDVSDPANIAVLSVIDMSASQPGPEKPVFVYGDGPRIYVANELHDSLTIYDANHHLDAPVVDTGDLQTAHLDVADDAAIHHDLAVHGALHVGPGGARIEGALSATGLDDSYIFGALGVGGAGAAISDTVLLTRTLWITAPTHALDVIGEGRFRVNDYHNLVLRSPNAGSDEDAYVDFVRSNQTTVMTPTARIQFDAADPFTHTTSIHFYTQGPGDATMIDRLEVTEEGHLIPGASGGYLLGSDSRRWDTVYTVNGVDQSSDGRDKDQVRTLSYGLDEVSALRPVIYTWSGDPARELHYGFIAQEVRQVLPEIVAGDEAEGSLSMSYSELVPVLVKAVQEQQEELEAQDERIAALEARLAALERARRDEAARPGWLDQLNPLWLGGLVLGALVLVGRRRLGGPS